MSMDLAEALRNYREKIVERWVQYTLSSYSSPEFFLKERDRFANPIGGAVRDGLGQLFPLLAKGAECSELLAPLSQIIHIRAVQEFSPSQAIAPINAVKHITREILAADTERAVFIKDLYDFEFTVDLAMLAAFDLYMEARERLYATRISEIKSGRAVLTDSPCPGRLLATGNASS